MVMASTNDNIASLN